MHPSTLREILNHALRVAVASPLLAGCSSGILPSDGGTDAGGGCEVASPRNVDHVGLGYASPYCITTQDSLRALSPSVIPDAIQLQRVCPTWLGCGGGGGGDFEPDGNLAMTVIAATGTPCAAASDRPTCEANFAAARATQGFGQTWDRCDTYYLVTTQGDQVKQWTSTDELKVFLGTIDTEQEAAFLAFAHHYQLDCSGQLDRGSVLRNPDGSFSVVAIRRNPLGGPLPVPIETRAYLRVDPDGTVTETMSDTLQCSSLACGRRPAGLQHQVVRRFGTPLANFLSASARLEAASVPAFLALRNELRVHGAEAQLVGSAMLAAMEEVTHARATAQLACRLGGFVRAPRVERRAPRPLDVVAIENATEGCVRETYGALVAQRQAAVAESAFVRNAFAKIAVDEARHSALSWEIDDWAQRRLGRFDRSRLRAARRAAVATLEKQLQTESSEALQREAGLPGAEQAIDSARRLFRALGT